MMVWVGTCVTGVSALCASTACLNYAVPVGLLIFHFSFLIYLASLIVPQPACELYPHGLTCTTRLNEIFIFNCSLFI